MFCVSTGLHTPATVHAWVEVGLAEALMASGVDGEPFPGLVPGLCVHRSDDI